MKRTLRSPLFASLLTAFLTAWPTLSPACSVCMGDPGTKAGPAINGAIFLMLGFVALMLGGVGAFVYNLARRAQAPVPPHVELSQMGTVAEDAR